MKLTKALVAALCASTLMSGAAFAQTDLTMWYHGAGNEVESKINQPDCL